MAYNSSMYKEFYHCHILAHGTTLRETYASLRIKPTSHEFIPHIILFIPPANAIERASRGVVAEGRGVMRELVPKVRNQITPYIVSTGGFSHII